MAAPVLCRRERMIKSKDNKTYMRGGVRIAFLLFVCAVFLSCSNDVAYSHFESTDSKGWNRHDEKLFTLVPTDTAAHECVSGIYDVLLVVRYADFYPYSKLHIAVERASLSVAPLTDTIALTLADDYGRWIGSGNSGIYEIADTIYKNLRIDEGYQITLSHAMHEDVLVGVNDVGIVLKKK